MSRIFQVEVEALDNENDLNRAPDLIRQRFAGTGMRATRVYEIPAEPGRRDAARQELLEGLAAELAGHLSNVRFELRRYETAVAHREHVFRLRTGQPEPITGTEARHG